MAIKNIPASVFNSIYCTLAFPSPILYSRTNVSTRYMENLDQFAKIRQLTTNLCLSFKGERNFFLETFSSKTKSFLFVFDQNLRQIRKRTRSILAKVTTFGIFFRPAKRPAKRWYKYSFPFLKIYCYYFFHVASSFLRYCIYGKLLIIKPPHGSHPHPKEKQQILGLPT